jgi:zinc protease
MPSAPSALPGPDTITRTVLDNGLVVLVRENHAAPVTVIDGYLPAGAMLDPTDKSGLAAFTASMLTRGSAHYPFDSFNEIVEGVGASLAAGADDHTLSFGATSLSEDYPQMLTVLADMLQRPTFAPEHIQRVRSQKLIRIQEREEDTQELAGLRFYETLYPDHPYGRATSGYADTVGAITREDLQAFHAQHITPQGGVIVVVGDVESDVALDLIRRSFGDWRGPTPDRTIPPVRPLTDVQTRTYDLPGKFQSDIYIGSPAVARTHPDFFPIRIANTILGRFAMMGRLGENVREAQGLAYYVYSTQDAGPITGLWYAAAGVNPANVDQAVASIQQEFARLAQEPVDEEELRDTQAYLTGILPLQLETNEGVAGTLLNMEWQGLGLDYLQRYNDLVHQVTVADVQRVARQYLRPDAYALVIAGPQTNS